MLMFHRTNCSFCFRTLTYIYYPLQLHLKLFWALVHACALSDNYFLGKGCKYLAVKGFPHSPQM